MRFFRAIISFAVALAVNICAAYAVSVIILGNDLNAVTLPTFAPTKILFEGLLIIYLLLAVVTISAGVYNKTLHPSLVVWGAILILSVLCALAFFKLNYLLFSLAIMAVLDCALIYLTVYYFRYTKELYLATFAMAAICIYLTIVNFATILLN